MATLVIIQHFLFIEQQLVCFLAPHQLVVPDSGVVRIRQSLGQRPECDKAAFVGQIHPLADGSQRHLFIDNRPLLGEMGMPTRRLPNA